MQISDAMVRVAVETYRKSNGGAESSMRAALQAALAGHVVVPREPTDEMCPAGYDVPHTNDGAHCDNRRELARVRTADIYRAMISAAPPALEREV